jgi:hypothetical protein
MELPPVQTTPAVPAKSNTAKIIIIIVAVLAVLCLISCAVGLLFFRGAGNILKSSVKTDEQHISSAVDKIATFDAPAGFSPASSMSLMGMTFVVYEGKDSNSAMILMQMPTGTELNDTNIKQMEEQMQRQSGRQMENFHVVKQYATTIRDQPAEVIISEGDSSGSSVRQMLVVFQGKSGLAMISIFGPTKQWNQSAYDKMIKSIK